ncbi:hypothetical protein H0H81_011657 [Sphagnurus paluster]|uniref:Uncharacterized protein n=1 Tax=Sphagnurus paluster TaxID=117069 RepID=A0A9P7KI84_9AGAR|nr:hypothetical protein H0H81_011657 [Sphagnurus paluster]
MRLPLSPSIVFAFSAVPLVTSFNVMYCGLEDLDVTRSCYRCPTIKYFNVGILSWDTVSHICLGYSAGSSDTRMACTYYEAGYKWTESWWGGSAERWQEPRFVGRCYFSEDGDLLTSGPYAGYSSSECPRKAYRENDSECAREKDKGAYYKCAQPNCAYETEMCYGCPRLSSDFVNVSSSNGSLTCGYSNEGKITNTCSFNGTDGRIISRSSNSPRCPGTATLATACERSRQERLEADVEKIAAAQKAAFIKSTYTDKGAIAMDCEEFISVKSDIRGHQYYVPEQYRTTLLLSRICKNPQDFRVEIHGGYQEFYDDLGAMVETEYGTLFVMSAEDKIKSVEVLKECQKRLREDTTIDQDSYRAPTDEEVDTDFSSLPVLPVECLPDDPSHYIPDNSPNDSPNDSTED